MNEKECIGYLCKQNYFQCSKRINKQCRCENRVDCIVCKIKICQEKYDYCSVMGREYKGQLYCPLCYDYITRRK